jgi:tetratricopeptide (TPR) repeat protein
MSKRSMRPQATFAIAALLALQLGACGSPESKAQGYYDDGMKLLAAKNYQVASVEFRNAVKAKRDMLPAWRGLAQTEEALQHWDGYVSVLRTILELDPKDDAARLKLAKLLLAGGAADQALKLANEVSDPNAADASLLALKAGIYYKLKDEDTAVRDAQAALKIDPHNIDALVIMSATRLANNDPQGALQLLSGDTENSDDIRISLLKIDIFQKLKDYPKLEAVLKTLADRNPQNAAFSKQLAALYISQHRLDDAEKRLRDLASANPGSSEDGLELVKFIFATKGPDAARQELDARIKAGGEVLPYQLALAEFDFGQGKTDDAFSSLKKLADSPDAQTSTKAKVMMAQLMLRQKDPAGAEKIVDAILQKDTRNDDALKLRALIRMDSGQLDGAITDLRSALGDQPRSTDLIMMLANAYERSGSIDLADKEYTEAQKVSGFDPRIGLLYVSFLQRHGNTDRAYDFLSELANRRPNSVPVLSAFAEAKLRRQDWAGAQEIAEQIKRLGNSEALADQIQGTALTGEHKYDASIAAFQSAVAAAPAAAQPMFALVNAMVNAKKTDQAIGFLQSVLKDNPNNASAYVLLGNVQLLNNQPDQALTNFNLAISKQPKSDLGYRALVDFNVRHNKPDAALDAVQAGLNAIPDNTTLQLTKAGLLERAGNYDGAIAQYQEMLNQQPGSPLIANNLASLLADYRTDKDSLDQAQALTSILRSSSVPQFKDTVGWVTYRLGNPKAAVPLLEEAVAKMPKNALVRYHLGMSYIGAGEPAQAADQFKEALNDQPAGDLEAKIKTGMKDISSQ